MKLFKEYEYNQHGNDYVIGDIHGKYELLMNELKLINFDFKKDRLFSVGDIIDRGEDSIKCLDLIYEDWFIPIRGNHEEMMFDCTLYEYDEKTKNLLNYQWFDNGGKWYFFLPTKDEKIDVLNTIEYAFKNMPIMIQLNFPNKKIGIVHANIIGDWNNLKENIHMEKNQFKALWDRKRIDEKLKDVVKNIDFVYTGHSVVKEPLKLGNVFCIDTGSCFTNKLTIVNLTQLYKG